MLYQSHNVVHVQIQNDYSKFAQPVLLKPIEYHTSPLCRVFYPSPRSKRLTKLLSPITVLSRISLGDIPMVRPLDKTVIPRCQRSAQERTSPVNPVIVRERQAGDTGPERARWIQRRARVAHARDLGDEKRQSDADGRNEGILGLLGREHQDREDKNAGEERFNEETLHFARVGAEGGINVGDVAGEHGGDEASRSHAAEDLDRDEDYAADYGELVC